jgi:hypothetical protein
MINYDLPQITIPGCTDAATTAAKYAEELAEWKREPAGTMSQLIEAWDVLQAAQTWCACPGSGSTATTAYLRARRVISDYAEDGRPVEWARRDMLRKNADRGYYSPEDCTAIITGEYK